MPANLTEVVDRFTGWDSALVDSATIPGVYDLGYVDGMEMAGLERTFRCAGEHESVTSAVLHGPKDTRAKVTIGERIRACDQWGNEVGPFQVSSIQAFPTGEVLLMLKDTT